MTTRLSEIARSLEAAKSAPPVSADYTRSCWVSKDIIVIGASPELAIFLKGAIANVEFLLEQLREKA